MNKFIALSLALLAIFGAVQAQNLGGFLEQAVNTANAITSQINNANSNVQQAESTANQTVQNVNQTTQDLGNQVSNDLLNPIGAVNNATASAVNAANTVQSQVQNTLDLSSLSNAASSLLNAVESPVVTPYVNLVNSIVNTTTVLNKTENIVGNALNVSSIAGNVSDAYENFTSQVADAVYSKYGTFDQCVQNFCAAQISLCNADNVCVGKPTLKVPINRTAVQGQANSSSVVASVPVTTNTSTPVNKTQKYQCYTVQIFGQDCYSICDADGESMNQAMEGETSASGQGNSSSMIASITADGEVPTTEGEYELVVDYRAQQNNANYQNLQLCAVNYCVNPEQRLNLSNTYNMIGSFVGGVYANGSEVVNSTLQNVNSSQVLNTTNQIENNITSKINTSSVSNQFSNLYGGLNLNLSGVVGNATDVYNALNATGYVITQVNSAVNRADNISVMLTTANGTQVNASVNTTSGNISISTNGSSTTATGSFYDCITVNCGNEADACQSNFFCAITGSDERGCINNNGCTQPGSYKSQTCYNQCVAGEVGSSNGAANALATCIKNSCQ